MFLKRICLQGFKSFADRVELEFGPGITGIVGPNGCGKSNVVDSFKWVLGEQSAKSLRGRQMMDMLFNGSSSRRSSATVEVELVFDNTDRRLPFDADEISVTRRLLRSGESEYLLGHQGVRLKDVRELFLDTGIGTDAYSVIEQGKVDVLLQSSPIERRVIFEEAAGISKYKVRRREAERKLERTQQNLLRIEDIIGEVEKRLRSVKQQAGKARSYQTYQVRLKELRGAFCMAEYHRLSEEVARHERDGADASDRVTALRTWIDRNEAESAQLTLRADAITDQLSGAESELVKVRSEMTAQQERMAGAARRAEEQQAHRDRALKQADVARQQRSQVEADLARAEREIEQLAAQVQNTHETIDALNLQDQEFARELTHVQAMLADEKAGIIELLRRTAQLHNEIGSLHTHRDLLVSRRGELSQRDAVIASELRETLERKSDLERRLHELDALISAETRRLEEKKIEARRVDSTRARLAEELVEAKERRSGLVSRHQVLQDLERSKEGIGAGVRCLLERKVTCPDDPQLGAVGGLVADVFDADVLHAAVIEAALGKLDEHLVVSDSRAFLSDESVFEALPGPLTAVCVDRLPPMINLRDFSEHAGYVARGIDLVRYPESLDRLARHLLAKTVVVRSLNDALALADQDCAGHRFVTLAGQVVEPDGRVRLGPATRATGLISRRSELRAIDEQIRALDAAIETLADQANRTSAEVAHLAELQHELRTAIYESHVAKVETNAILQTIQEGVRRLTSEQPMIAGEVALIERQIEEAGACACQSQASLGKLENENRVRESEIARHEQRIDELARLRKEVAERLTEVRVAAAQWMEKRAAVLETLHSFRRAQRTAQETLDAAETEARDCQARIEESQATLQACQARLADLTALNEHLDGERLRLKRDRETLRARLEELAASTRARRSDLDEAEQRLHAVQMALHEMRVRRDDLTARTSDELGIELPVLYATYRPAEQDWQAVEDEIAELRGKIERLGNVNLDAIAEQEELEQRHGFLTSQRDDLTQSLKGLEQLVGQLNAESRRRFREAFERIRENFQELFRKLFGGGKADILLEDPDDVLDCGIEIVAKPPGKELQSLSLLSGGEKAMTAIALLMAIFRSKPAPFAILDEVDAALDESNNVRFNTIVQEFLDRSQFIIITHSKRTMTIADRLYGITMQEPGVSTLVSVKFDPGESAERHAVA